MRELPAAINCTVIGWGKKEDKKCEFVFICCAMQVFLLAIDIVSEKESTRVDLRVEEEDFICTTGEAWEKREGEEAH